MNARRLDSTLQKTLKKVLAMLIALVLILTIMPNLARADDATAAAANGAATAGTTDPAATPPDDEDIDEAEIGEAEIAETEIDEAEIGEAENLGIAAAATPFTIATPGVTYVHEDKVDSAGGVSDGTFEKPYKTLQAAYDDSADNDEIRVLSDLTVTAQTNFNASKTVTIQSYTDENTVKTGGGHTITANTGSYTYGMLNISAGSVTLKNITFDAARKDRVANVVVGATLDIQTGAVLKNGYRLVEGSAHNDGGGGVFTQGMLTLSGGTIQNNEVNCTTTGDVGNNGGGGVYVHSLTGIFTMTSGTIQDNVVIGDKNISGGGVLSRVGTFNMSGGLITGNTASLAGGGVTLSQATFVMTGGTIENNNAGTNFGGVFNWNSTVKMGGGAPIIIKVNTSGTGAAIKTDNVHMAQASDIIQIISPITAGSDIGVYCGNMPNATATVRTIAIRENTSVNISAADAAFFKSDRPTEAGIRFTATQIGAGNAGTLGQAPANSVILDYAKREVVNATTGLNKTTGDGFLKVNDTNSNKQYILVGPSPSDKVVAGKQGNNGSIIFDGLEPGAEYTVVVVDGKGALPKPGDAKPASTEQQAFKIPSVSENATAAIKGQPAKASITIDPSSSKVKYAVVDPTTGNVVTGWQAGNGGPITFDGLDPGKEYEIVTVPITENNPSGSGWGGEGTTVKTPSTGFALDTGDISRDKGSPSGKDKIVINPTKPTQEYAIVDEDGNVLEWKDGTGGAITFDGLDPSKTYKVITREKGTPPSLPSAPVTVLPKLSGDIIEGSDDSAHSGKTVITINPTDSSLDYGLVDKNGDSVGSWKSGGGSVSFDNLDPAEDYTVVTRPKNDGSIPKPEDAQGGLEVVSPPQAVTPVTREDSTTAAGKDKITFPTESGKEYAVYEKGSDTPVSGGNWANGTGNDRTVDNLDPTKDYEVRVRVQDTSGGTDGKTYLENSTDVPATADFDVTGKYISDTNTSITIDPTVPGKKYLVVDPITGAVMGTAIGDGQPKTVGGLPAGKEYKVVVVDENENPTATQLKNKSGKTIVTPIKPVDSKDITATNTTITVNPTSANQSYAIVDPVTGKVVGEWKDGNGGAVTFDGLTPGKVYEVVTVPKPLPAGTTKDNALYRPGTGIKTTTETGKVTGMVTDHNGAPLPGVEVSIVSGGTDGAVIGTAITDANGNYSFDSLPTGSYSLVFKPSPDVTITKIVTIKNGGTTTLDAQMPDGNQSTIVEVKGNTPSIAAGNLEGMFSAQDIADSQSGGAITIKLQVEKVDAPADANIVEQNLQGRTLGMYLDLQLFKTVSGTGTNRDGTSNIKEAPGMLTIVVDLPEALWGFASYSIIRVHDGVSTTIPATYDATLHTLTFSTDKFSTYAIAYYVTNPTPPNNRSSSSGGSGGGSGAAAVSTHWIEVAEAKSLSKDAQSKGLDYAKSSSATITGIRKNSLLEIDKAGLTYRHDTTLNGAVQVRVYIDEPGKARKDILVSAYVSGDKVNAVKSKFEKAFPDKKLAVVSFDQQGDFGMTVRVAAKVNLNGMDESNLYFYAYDKATNKYVNFQPEYWVDSNGFLHFATYQAGDIIISDGPLKDKDARDAGNDGNWWNPGTGGDGFDNPGTGGDGSGYFIQDIVRNAAQTQASDMLSDINIQVTALSGTQQLSQTAPIDSMGPIKLQVPNIIGYSVTLPSPQGGNSTIAFTLALGVGLLLLAAGLSLWPIVAMRRRRNSRQAYRHHKYYTN